MDERMRNRWWREKMTAGDYEFNEGVEGNGGRGGGGKEKRGIDSS